MFYIYCYKTYFDQSWLGGPVSNVGGPVSPRPITGYTPDMYTNTLNQWGVGVKIRKFLSCQTV